MKEDKAYEEYKRKWMGKKVKILDKLPWGGEPGRVGIVTDIYPHFLLIELENKIRITYQYWEADRVLKIIDK